MWRLIFRLEDYEHVTSDQFLQLDEFVDQRLQLDDIVFQDIE